MSSNCQCPYCDHFQRDDPDDCQEPEVSYEWECESCEKNFIFEIEYDPTYNERKAPCLNGGKHKYKLQVTYPKEYSKEKCIYCDKYKEHSSI